MKPKSQSFTLSLPPQEPWHFFVQKRPPLGTEVLIQANSFQPIKYTFECDDCHENALGTGPDFCCFVEYGNQGQVHVSKLMWRYLP
jgi:hypothetical protein